MKSFTLSAPLPERFRIFSHPLLTLCCNGSYTLSTLSESLLIFLNQISPLLPFLKPFLRFLTLADPIVHSLCTHLARRANTRAYGGVPISANGYGGRSMKPLGNEQFCECRNCASVLWGMIPLHALRLSPTSAGIGIVYEITQLRCIGMRGRGGGVHPIVR